MRRRVEPTLARHAASLAAVLVLVSMLGQRRAVAQHVPVVMVHGLHEDSTIWYTMKNNLTDNLAADSLSFITPTLSSELSINYQADQLYSRLTGIGSATAIAIGHSNGGLISRQTSRALAMRGILTFGTPHAGVPAVDQIGTAEGFVDGLATTLNNLAGDLLVPCWELGDWCYAALGLVEWAVNDVVIPSKVGDALDQFLPTDSLLLQDQVGSGFLVDLNSPTNLASEGQRNPSRVGVVVTTRNYFVGGPLRLLEGPAAADADALEASTVATSLWMQGDMVSAEVDSLYQVYLWTGSQEDWNHYVQAYYLAGDLYSLSVYFGFYEDVWLEIVGGGPNDGFLPTSVQSYPGGLDVPVLADWAHSFEYFDPYVVNAVYQQVRAIVEPGRW